MNVDGLIGKIVERNTTETNNSLPDNFISGTVVGGYVGDGYHPYLLVEMDDGGIVAWSYDRVQLLS